VWQGRLRAGEAGRLEGDGLGATGPHEPLELEGELDLSSGRDLDAIARDLIEADGRWPAYGHGLGHGIGLATHEAPSLSRHATEAPLPSPTVFSVEPGIYLEGEMGVRIEDLVSLDAGSSRVDRLTQFPRDVLVVGTERAPS